MLTLIVALFSLPILGSLALTPRPTPESAAGQGARHRAPGLPKLITWAEDKVTAPRHRAVSAPVEQIAPAQLDDTGQLELIH